MSTWCTIWGVKGGAVTTAAAFVEENTLRRPGCRVVKKNRGCGRGEMSVGPSLRPRCEPAGRLGAPLTLTWWTRWGVECVTVTTAAVL